VSWQDILKRKSGRRGQKARKKRKKKKRKTSPCCYRKVSSRYKGGNSAYRSGAFVACDKVGCENWGKSVKKANPLKTWFEQSARGEKGKPKVKGWVSCQSCEDDKAGAKPCGRKDASKGTKQRCRPTCSACKTYKRRKGK